MNNTFPTIVQLVQYEVDCNLRLADALAELPDEQLRRDFGFGLRTPHRTLAHIVDVMRGWSACVGPVIEQPRWSTYDETATVAQIRRTITDVGAAWLAAAKASHEQGVLADDRRLHQVFHLVTHGTHHRGQLLSMLTLMGEPQPFEGGDFGGWSKTST